MHTGSCLCGAVSFEVAGELAAPEACHCTRCRKLSGHVWSSTDVPRDQLVLSGEEHVRWYATSDVVRRGFCDTCGSQLFWDARTKDTIAVAMGAFDAPTGTRLGIHIFVANKGDYYDIADGLPQNAR